MAHIYEYVSWRGDLPFSEREFRIEDNLVLSELVYIDYRPVLEGRVSLSLRDAITELSKAGILKNTRAGAGREDEDFALACAFSKRFGDAVLVDFQDIYDSSDRQFAAVTYLLDDGTTVIAFRGTDSTIVGWKEDFMISYTNVPSQDLALTYSRKHVNEAKDNVIILGHSKGAHLALYSAAHLDKEQMAKVNRVYINDGPGFCGDVLKKSLLDEIKDKVTKITPEYSIIGRIFEPEAGEEYIVKSSAMALLQHNIQSWLLADGGGLELCQDHAPESHLINDLIDRFVEGMDLSARENFIETLFGSMAETGVATIREFASQGPVVFEELLMKMAGNDALAIKKKSKRIKKSDDDRRSFLLRLWGLINRSKKVRIGVSVLLSILCFVVPDFAMESVLFAAVLIICVYEVFLTVGHLRDSEWDFRKERPRVLTCTILLAVTAAIVVKKDALFIISSLAVSIILFALSYQNVINYIKYKDKLLDRFRYFLEGAVTLFLGCYILMAQNVDNSWYMLSCGTLLLIDSVFEIIKLIRDRKKS
ncbi:MAG: DUF2974 domain-containing protein [Butyrivibrio sp.]|nr:DUF2974 domain-containing protein [Butyrivibrio sp.]